MECYIFETYRFQTTLAPYPQTMSHKSSAAEESETLSVPILRSRPQASRFTSKMWNIEQTSISHGVTVWPPPLHRAQWNKPHFLRKLASRKKKISTFFSPSLVIKKCIFPLITDLSWTIGLLPTQMKNSNEHKACLTFWIKSLQGWCQPQQKVFHEGRVPAESWAGLELGFTPKGDCWGCTMCLHLTPISVPRWFFSSTLQDQISIVSRHLQQETMMFLVSKIGK